MKTHIKVSSLSFFMAGCNWNTRREKYLVFLKTFLEKTLDNQGI
jgi:hypothetical protein